jgi:hypothetical protein
MKRQHWTVTRRQISCPAAQRRWDRAYQLLMQITEATQPGKTGAPIAGDCTRKMEMTLPQVLEFREVHPGGGADEAAATAEQPRSTGSALEGASPCHGSERLRPEAADRKESGPPPLPSLVFRYVTEISPTKRPSIRRHGAAERQ